MHIVLKLVMHLIQQARNDNSTSVSWVKRVFPPSGRHKWAVRIASLDQLPLIQPWCLGHDDRLLCT